MFSFAVAVPMTRKLGHGLSVFPPANDSRQTGYSSYLVTFFFFSLSRPYIRSHAEKLYKKKKKNSLPCIGVLLLQVLGNYLLSFYRPSILGNSREFFPPFNPQITYVKRYVI